MNKSNCVEVEQLEDLFVCLVKQQNAYITRQVWAPPEGGATEQFLFKSDKPQIVKYEFISLTPLD